MVLPTARDIVIATVERIFWMCLTYMIACGSEVRYFAMTGNAYLEAHTLTLKSL